MSIWLRGQTCYKSMSSAAASLCNFSALGNSHPGHAIALRQMTAPGAMLSVCIRGGREAAFGVLAGLRLFTRATSLGGVESLVEHRASIEGAGSRAPENLLRISVGLEHPDDLVDDLREALGTASGA